MYYTCMCSTHVHMYVQSNTLHVHMYSFSFTILDFFVSRAIKVWDFQAALDPRTPSDALCLRTLVVSQYFSLSTAS